METRISRAANATELVLSITAPSVPRLPCDVVFVIDRSGSMGSDATPGLDESERDGVTILDLTSSLIKVWIECLGDEDRVGVVTFDERATVTYPMAYMTPSKKLTACSRLDSVRVSGGTQIWSGIQLGLETMRQADIPKKRNRCVLVFTDGLDVKKPLRGNMHELQSWVEANAECRFAMHTVGFGNELDSRELHEMADLMNGTFSHIPEATTAGTILINRCATELAQHGSNLCVSVTKSDGTVVSSTHGAIRIGQTRTFPIGSDAARVEVSFFDGAARQSTQVDMTVVESDVAAKCAVMCAVKSDLVATLRHVIETLESSSLAWALPYCAQQFAGFRARCELLLDADVPYVAGCIADVKDQLHKSVETEKWVTSWGLHYLRSFLHATTHEVVNNFRDHSVQHFASPAFLALQAHCEKVFLAAPLIPKKMPAPLARSSSGSVPRSVTRLPVALPANAQQARYYDQGGGCFSPDARIYMHDWIARPIGALRKGDQVRCSGGRIARVVCVVFSSGYFEMVSVDGFTLTPTHPVLGPAMEWVYPRDLYPRDLSASRSESTRVVNLLLDGVHEVIGAGTGSMLVCCTLAHGLRGPVVGHAYLGTDAVARELKCLPGFEEGHVEATFTRTGGHITGVIAAADFFFE